MDGIQQPTLATVMIVFGSAVVFAVYKVRIWFNSVGSQSCFSLGFHATYDWLHYLCTDGFIPHAGWDNVRSHSLASRFDSLRHRRGNYRVVCNTMVLSDGSRNLHVYRQCHRKLWPDLHL